LNLQAPQRSCAKPKPSIKYGAFVSVSGDPRCCRDSKVRRTGTITGVASAVIGQPSRAFAGKAMDGQKSATRTRCRIIRLTKKAAPRLLGRFGVGPQTACTLLVTARVTTPPATSEAALAVCGNQSFKHQQGSAAS
jgi:hypothetical protein